MQLTQYQNSCYKACIRTLQKKNKPYTWKNEITTSRGRYKKKTHRKEDFFANHNSSCESPSNISETGRTVSEVFGILTFNFIRHTT